VGVEERGRAGRRKGDKGGGGDQEEGEGTSHGGIRDWNRSLRPHWDITDCWKYVGGGGEGGGDGAKTTYKQNWNTSLELKEQRQVESGGRNNRRIWWSSYPKDPTARPGQLGRGRGLNGNAHITERLHMRSIQTHTGTRREIQMVCTLGEDNENSPG